MSLLVIDQGGHSTRAIVFDKQHKIKAIAQREVSPLLFLADADNANFIEFCPKLIWQSLQEVLDEVIDLIDAEQLEQAALIAQRSSFIACYKDSLEPITNIVSWQDTRYADYLAEIFSDESTLNGLSVEAFRKITGLYPNAHLGFSKMRYLLEHDEGVKQALAADNLIFLPLSSWLSAKLCNLNLESLKLDIACAQRMGLLDVHRLSWSETLLSAFSIPPNVLACLSDGQSHYGAMVLNTHLALKSLKAKLPLCLVSGDQSLLPFAAGKNLEHISVNIGTGAFVLSSAVDTNLRMLKSVAAFKQGELVAFAEGTVNAAASAIDWYVDEQNMRTSSNALHQRCAQAFEFTNHQDVPLFYNAVAGLGSPFWQAKSCAYFYNADTLETMSLANAEESIQKQLLAVQESIVFLLAINIEALRKEASWPISLSGGLSNNHLLAQCLANITGRKVNVLDEKEASAVAVSVFVQGANFTAQHSACFSPQESPLLSSRYVQFKKLLKDKAA